MFDVHVAVAGILQVDGGLLGQLANALDGVDLTRNLGKDGGGVAGPGTNLEHSFAAFQLQSLNHEGHNVRLGNGLTTADRERSVRVSMLAKLARNEGFAWHSFLVILAEPRISNEAARLIPQHAQEFSTIDEVDLDPLLERVGDARVALLGPPTVRRSSTG